MFGVLVFEIKYVLDHCKTTPVIIEPGNPAAALGLIVVVYVTGVADVTPTSD